MNMIIEILRQKILACGKSRYEIHKATGIDQAALCRIMQGSGCTVSTADKLFEYFKLKVVETERQ